jgi:magnesium transporter
MKQRPGVPTVRTYAPGETGLASPNREAATLLIRDAPKTLSVPADGNFVWIDINYPTEPEAAFLRDELGMHPLAVEDTLRGRQRPKIDRYPGYLFLVYYACRINPDRQRMALNELHLFLGSTFLITVHDFEIPEIAQVVANWKANPDRLKDPGAIAHALLDAVTDNYFPVVEHFSNRLEQFEEKIFSGDTDVSLQGAIVLRHEIIMLRRVLAPQRDLLSSLLRHDLALMRPELVPYFQDVHDHILRVAEEIDAFRDLLTGLVEVQSSNAANRLNRTMQTLTSWSIILMTVGVIAGIYGMNFVHMPELHLTWGYYGALGLMLAAGAILIGFFRARGWL